VQKALELMRTDLARRWTVTSLARRVGLSRPAFARRFVDSTGESPLKYLTRARMQHAARLLGETRWSLAQIGVAVGYASEFAFNRAFKRLLHVAPGTFRRAARIATPMMRAAA
jgi:transcriptional regulator GlxA family with amidase domain